MASRPAAPSVSRVSFVSLGCPKNLVDSEKMLGVLKDSGFVLVNEDQRPRAAPSRKAPRVGTGH